MSKWIETWLRKKTCEFLDSWLKDNEESIQRQKAELEKTNQDLNRLKSTISEIQEVTMNVPVEQYILKSDQFQECLNIAIEYAMIQWPPLTVGKGLTITLPSINGTVSKAEPFQSTIREDQVVALAGFKTAYITRRRDQALYKIQIGDRFTKPFVVNRTTQQVILLKPYCLRPEELFCLFQLEGSGKLDFSLIGASVCKWRGI